MGITLVAVLVGIGGVVVAAVMESGSTRRRQALFRDEIRATGDLEPVVVKTKEGRAIAVRFAGNEGHAIVALPTHENPSRPRWRILLGTADATHGRAVVVSRRGELRTERASGLPELDIVDTPFQFNGRIDAALALCSLTHAVEALERLFADAAVRSLAIRDGHISCDVDMLAMNAREARKRMHQFKELIDVLGPVIAGLPEGAVVSGSTSSGDPFPIPLFRR